MNRYQVFLSVEKRAQIRASFQWPLGTEKLAPGPRSSGSFVILGRDSRSLIPLTSNCFCYLFKILGVGVNVRHIILDWVSISGRISGMRSKQKSLRRALPYAFILKYPLPTHGARPMSCLVFVVAIFMGYEEANKRW